MPFSPGLLSPVNDKYSGISKLTIKSKRGGSTVRAEHQQWAGAKSGYGMSKAKSIKLRRRQKYGLLTAEEMLANLNQTQAGEGPSDPSHSKKAQDEFIKKIIPMNHQHFYPSVKIGAFQYTTSPFSSSPSKLKLRTKREAPEQLQDWQLAVDTQKLLTQMKFKNHSMDYDFIDEQRHQLGNMHDHQLKFGKDRFDELKRTLFSPDDNNPCLFPSLSPVSYKAQNGTQTRMMCVYSPVQREIEGSQLATGDQNLKKRSVFHRKHNSYSHAPHQVESSLDQRSRKQLEVEDFIVGEVGKAPFLLPNLCASNSRHIGADSDKERSLQLMRGQGESGRPLEESSLAREQREGVESGTALNLGPNWPRAAS